MNKADLKEKFYELAEAKNTGFDVFDFIPFEAGYNLAGQENKELRDLLFLAYHHRKSQLEDDVIKRIEQTLTQDKDE